MGANALRCLSLQFSPPIFILIPEPSLPSPAFHSKPYPQLGKLPSQLAYHNTHFTPISSPSVLLRRTYLACNKASRISTSVAPFLTAPLTCVPSSIHLLKAVSITRFKRLRSLRLSPGRVQIVPHALSYSSQRFRFSGGN